MKAAVLHGREEVRIEELAEAPLQKGEVRVEIQAALTCGTDLKVYRRGYHARMIVPPAVFGHEFAGVICEVGEGVVEWRAGDRVVVANSAPCDACYYCQHEQWNLCDDLMFLNGAYAERIVVPPRVVQRNMLRLKPATSFADAALTEPLACVVLGMEESGIRDGQKVLVLGGGPIGLMFVAMARHSGCQVTVVGRGAERLEMARQLGANQVVNLATRTNTGLVIQNEAPDRYDVVIEAVGKPETWEAAFQSVRKGGTVNFFGGCPSGTTIQLDTGRMHYGSIRLLGSFHHTPRTVQRALELIEEGAIRAADFVSGECSLQELPELFASMSQGNRFVKTRIAPRP